MYKEIKLSTLHFTDMLSETASDHWDSVSDSSDENEHFVKKIENYVEDTVASYSLKTFQQHFRVNKSIAYTLIGRLYICVLNP